ncbi:hypothetical protein HYC85_029890 [Camellia sinensis]|uniref:Uncharacterized protein n=1 Tax=Camellia sinensis TaxID=4442 RepID=A0A7J7FZD3_CAMSI|nr:hypothetical protein HYC85_029890 [Camellia sinensis]
MIHGSDLLHNIKMTSICRGKQHGLSQFIHFIPEFSATSESPPSANRYRQESVSPRPDHHAAPPNVARCRCGGR